MTKKLKNVSLGNDIAGGPGKEGNERVDIERRRMEANAAVAVAEIAAAVVKAVNLVVVRAIKNLGTVLIGRYHISEQVDTETSF